MNTGIMPSLCMNLLQSVCLPASAAMLLYRLAVWNMTSLAILAISTTATTTAATTTTPTSTPSPAPTPTVRLYSTGRSY